MPRISRSPLSRAPLDRSFEGSRYQERFLATAFEAAVPIIHRRSERIDDRRDRPATPPRRQASLAPRGG